MLATDYLEQSILDFDFDDVDTISDDIALYAKWLDSMQVCNKMYKPMPLAHLHAMNDVNVEKPA